MSVLVYTSITNNHDRLKLQPVFEEDKGAHIDYIAYLDRTTTASAEKSKTTEQWNIRVAVNNFKEPKRNCQTHKILSHMYIFDNDYNIWIDGSVVFKAPVTKLIADNMDGADIALLWHFERDCIYEEAKDCIHFNLDDPEKIYDQLDFYRQINFPKHFGLSETPVIIRRNTKDVMTFNNLWWSILCRYSKRDQLSFDFVRWTLAMPVNHIEGNIHENEYFSIAKHEVLRKHEK